MSDLLKEAIADAKAVRETALQNAKMALEEAFTPQLKSMLSAKLREDDDEEFEEQEDEFSAEEQEDEFEEDEVPVEEQEDELEEDEHDEVPAEEQEDDMEEDDDELDLEAIIRELEQEVGEDEVTDGELEDQEDEVGDGEETDNMEDEAPGMEEDDVFDVDESLFKEMEGDNHPNEFDEEDDVDEDDAGDGMEEDDMEDEAPGMDEDDVYSENKRIKKRMKEYVQAVRFLKDKLHEVNILNAKLLFTNKLFKEFALTNDEKMRVVETFDRAQTTREIKLVYSTLGQFHKSGNTKRKTRIKESASVRSGSTRPARKVITEVDQVANRFKKLAGLIK